jgi:3-dehydroquinate synthase
VEEWARVLGCVLDGRPDRDTHILAFGGGVVGDLAGFVAATALRGLPLVQVPTTLLAMVDASVGGKTAVNTPQGKNLVGAFHQPRLVWAPLDTLATLPPRELRGGLGEIVKHAILEGPEALAALEVAAPALARGEGLGEQVASSILTKARIVSLDPTERGVRAHLNLGHTLGHAIEAVAGYGALAHGEAIALGLLAVTRLAVELGQAKPAFAERVFRLLTTLALPTVLPGGLDPAALVRAMGFDKKRQRGMVRLVIVTDPGQVELCPVSEAALARLPALVSA